MQLPLPICECCRNVGHVWRDCPDLDPEQRDRALRREKTSRIAELNDLCRTAMGVVCHVYQTAGIAMLPAETQSRIRERVETFDEFTRANDPYGEHDFGACEVDGIQIFWKIDYYDKAGVYGSEDPSDPSQTKRVLTIMRAEEY